VGACCTLAIVICQQLEAAPASWCVFDVHTSGVDVCHVEVLCPAPPRTDGITGCVFSSILVACRAEALLTCWSACSLWLTCV
jgi:hypothetical protein